MRELDELERRVRELERTCDREYAPLAGRIDGVSARVDTVVAELGGVEPDERRRSIRTRLHTLEGDRAGLALLSDFRNRRGVMVRRWATCGAAIVAAAGELGRIAGWWG